MKDVGAWIFFTFAFAMLLLTHHDTAKSIGAGVGHIVAAFEKAKEAR